MKVLKLVPWSHTFTCAGCKSELEVEPTDVRQGVFGACHYAGESGENRFYVVCTVCGCNHVISDDKVPTNVQRDAIERSRR